MDEPTPRPRRALPARVSTGTGPSPRRAAAVWDERYREPGFAYGTAPNDFLVAVAERLPAQGRVLCLGEGEGRNAVWLAARGHTVHAVDLSAVGLDKAQRLAAARGVAITTERADLAGWDLGRGRWDAIVSIFCHLEPAARRAVHAAVAEALRPGGAFVLEAFAPPHGAAAPDRGAEPAALHLGLADARAELGALFLPIARKVVRGVFEGRCHAGPRAVVQVLASRPR